MAQSVSLIVEHTWIVAEVAKERPARVQNELENMEHGLEGR